MLLELEIDPPEEFYKGNLLPFWLGEETTEKTFRLAEILEVNGRDVLIDLAEEEVDA